MANLTICVPLGEKRTRDPRRPGTNEQAAVALGTTSATAIERAVAEQVLVTRAAVVAQAGAKAGATEAKGTQIDSKNKSATGWHFASDGGWLPASFRSYPTLGL